MKRLLLTIFSCLALEGCKSGEEKAAEVAVENWLSHKALVDTVRYRPISSESTVAFRFSDEGDSIRGYIVDHEFGFTNNKNESYTMRGTYFVDSVGKVVPQDVRLTGAD
jgi:hypothetical protein